MCLQLFKERAFLRSGQPGEELRRMLELVWRGVLMDGAGVGRRNLERFLGFSPIRLHVAFLCVSFVVNCRPARLPQVWGILLCLIARLSLAHHKPILRSTGSGKPFLFHNRSMGVHFGTRCNAAFVIPLPGSAPVLTPGQNLQRP
jgi:hypothetical protein